MRVGPGDTTLQSQIQAQLTAGQRTQQEASAAFNRQTLEAGTARPVREPDESRQATARPRPLTDPARRGVGGDQGGQQPPLTRNTGDATLSSERSALTLSGEILSSPGELEEAEARVGSLFGREAPIGRTSARVEETAAPVLGQIIDIRV